MTGKASRIDTPVDLLIALGERPGDGPKIRTALAARLYAWRRGEAAGSAADVALLAEACNVSRGEAMRAVLETIREAREGRSP